MKQNSVMSESYLERVQRNKRENRELLKKLGIFSETCKNEWNQVPNSSQPSPSNESVKQKKRPKKRPSIPLEPTRKSARLSKQEPVSYKLDDIDLDHTVIPQKKSVKRHDRNTIDEFNEEFYQPPKEKIKRENFFGAVPDIPVGTLFRTRLDASAAGIHRPTVAGIHGNPNLGCYSLALSGGYEDDVDLGESFIYTGEGGRDLKGTKANPKNLRTAPQSKDQVLERGNLALSMNITNNVPVRVLRGYKLRSQYAPIEGYRYDGLYKVTEYYTAKGLSGFNVYKFKLVRDDDQDPAPWMKLSMNEEENLQSKED